MALSRRVRFEVFKRDKFTCQYCAKKAPDVVSHVDHIEPRSTGGSDEILNLVTSCLDCNQGKSNIRLSDDAAVNKQRSQLDALQERREQLEMMLEWQRSLINIDADQEEELAKFWSECVPPFSHTPNGRSSLRKLIRKFGPEGVIEAMKIAAAQNPEYDASGNLSEIRRQLGKKWAVSVL